MRIIKAPFHPRGGVHPVYCKTLTADKPVRPLPLPAKLYLPLSQHLGAPAKALVKKGDVVHPGQLLAAAEGFVSAAVHAPAGGKIAAVENMTGPAGKPVPTVVIETDAADQDLQRLPPLADWQHAERRALVDRVAAAGIVGMGGAGFPTHVKLSPPAGKTVDTLIVNGAECEPYLTADYRLLLEQPERVWLGAAIIGYILQVKHIAVAIEDNKPEAIRNMAAAMRRNASLSPCGDNVAVVVLPTHYPQGAEKQQIYAVTGREVPSGGLPMDVGCLVENVATCAAICAAVVDGTPLMERIVTVTGGIVRDPQNVRAPLGATYASLLDFCGGMAEPPGKIICGGPMMGLAQCSLDMGITKTTSGLLVLSCKEVSQFVSMPCISCGRCVSACPMGLLPCELGELAEHEDFDAAERAHVLDCIECGSCAYECPAHRPLVQLLRRAKAEVSARRRARSAAAAATTQAK